MQAGVKPGHIGYFLQPNVSFIGYLAAYEW
jgi:hypothetical protein